MTDALLLNVDQIDARRSFGLRMLQSLRGSKPVGLRTRSLPAPDRLCGCFLLVRHRPAG